MVAMVAYRDEDGHEVIPVPELHGYPFGPEDPYAAGHELLDRYLEGPFAVEYWWEAIHPRDSAAGRAILTSAPYTQKVVAHAVLDRLAWLAAHEWRTWHGRRSHRQALEGLARALFARQLPFDRDDLAHILRVVVSGDDLRWQPWRGVLSALERYLAAAELPAAFGPLLERQRELLTGHYLQAAYRPLVLRIDELLGRGEPGLPDVGEPWAELLLATLAAMDEPAYSAWRALLAHIPATNGVKPSRAWLEGAREHLGTVGIDAFKRVALDLLESGARYVPAPLSDRNAMTLKGLVWYCGLYEDDKDIAYAVSRLAVALYATVPGEGPRSSLAAGACLHALGAMPGMAPLAGLVQVYERVLARAVRDDVARLFVAAAARTGASWDELRLSMEAHVAQLHSDVPVAGLFQHHGLDEPHQRMERGQIGSARDAPLQARQIVGHAAATTPVAGMLTQRANTAERSRQGGQNDGQE